MGKNRNGFTLIEVLISSALFGIGILAVSAMNIYALKSAAANYEMSKAVYMAYEKMEYLSGQDVSSFLTDGNYKETDIEGLYNMDFSIRDFSSFSKKIDIKIYWSKLGKDKALNVYSLTRGCMMK